MSKEKKCQAYETLKKSLESQKFMAMLNDTIGEIGADNPLLSAEYMYEKIKAFLQAFIVNIFSISFSRWIMINDFFKP